MRLHSLTISAFGPFPDTVTVDLDSLAHDGLFLIHGPTGSGKTTILDALAFGLYGRVPGARNDAAQFRSQFASPTTPTEVTLEFSAQGRRYRVRRNPAYDRPKRRGTGTVTEKAGAQLLRWDGTEWAGLGRTATEVQAHITRALQLTADQFTKIVLLPQGEFAAFLRAAPQEREPILRRLFATEHFTAVEDRLAEAARGARSRMTAVSAQRSALIDRALAVHGANLPRPTAEHPDVGDVESVLGPSRAIGIERLESAQVVRHEAESAAARSGESARAARERLRDRTRLRELRDLERIHEDGAEDRRRIRTQQERIREATVLRPALHELRDAEEKHRLSAESDAAARRTLASALTDLAPGASARTPDALADLGRTITGAAQRLARSLAHREALVAEAADADRAVEDQVERNRTADAELARTRERRAAIEDELSGESAVAAQTERAREALRRSAEQLAAAERFAALGTALSAARSEAAERRTDQERARTEYEDIRRRRIEGIAAELSAELSPGVACPVCGSSEHPAPASPAGPAVGRAAEEQAHATWEERQSAALRALERTARLEEQHAQARTEAGSKSVETSGAAHAEAQRELSDLEDRLRRLQELRAESGRLETALATLAEAAQERETRLAALRSAAVSIRGRLDQLEASEAARAARDLERAGLTAPASPQAAEKVADHGERITASAAEASRAAGVLADASDALRRRREVFESGLQDSSFDGVDDLRSALGLDAQRLAAEDRAHEERWTRIALMRESDWYPAALADTADDDELTALTTAEDALEELWRARVTRAVERLAVARRHVADLDALRSEFRSRTAEDEAELDGLRTDIALSGLVQATSPENVRRISLSSYALVALFADVAANASERLRVMSRGRYSLVHDDVIHRREKRAGLGLQVVDGFTQERRDPRTLSGGESFMAALALALGLADTVRATAGGIELDSLFIDEGFGTLDPDALSEVLGILDELREGGRTVGVISHVQGMLQAIPNQIVLESSPTGSRIRVDVRT